MPEPSGVDRKSSLITALPSSVRQSALRTQTRSVSMSPMPAAAPVTRFGGASAVRQHIRDTELDDAMKGAPIAPLFAHASLINAGGGAAAASDAPDGLRVSAAASSIFRTLSRFNALETAPPAAQYARDTDERAPPLRDLTQWTQAVAMAGSMRATPAIAQPVPPPAPKPAPLLPATAQNPRPHKARVHSPNDARGVPDSFSFRATFGNLQNVGVALAHRSLPLFRQGSFAAPPGWGKIGGGAPIRHADKTCAPRPDDAAATATGTLLRVEGVAARNSSRSNMTIQALLDTFLQHARVVGGGGADSSGPLGVGTDPRGACLFDIPVGERLFELVDDLIAAASHMDIEDTPARRHAHRALGLVKALFCLRRSRSKVDDHGSFISAVAAGAEARAHDQWQAGALNCKVIELLLNDPQREARARSRNDAKPCVARFAQREAVSDWLRDVQSESNDTPDENWASAIVRDLLAGRRQDAVDRALKEDRPKLAVLISAGGAITRVDYLEQAVKNCFEATTGWKAVTPVLALLSGDVRHVSLQKHFSSWLDAFAAAHFFAASPHAPVRFSQLRMIARGWPFSLPASTPTPSPALSSYLLL